MDEVAESVLAFIRWTDAHPLPANVPTRVVLKVLRAHLDRTAPGWRERVFEGDAGPDAVEVEVHLQSGRVIRGALAQQASEAGRDGDAE
jgi:hypothetical protein